MNLNQILEPIQDELSAFEARFKEVLSGESSFIWEISQHLLENHGKRLRPACVLLVSRAFGEKSERGIETAVALELIHTATLLHDDVIDQSPTRRGEMTVSYKWSNLVSVLMGDYLFAKAFRTLVGIGSPSIMKTVSSATERVSIGQLNEIKESKNFALAEGDYLKIISDKTASLFAAACESGCILHQSDQKQIAGFKIYGQNFGMAFQIVDDLLDIIGNQEKTGKEVGTDLREGKVTLPLIYSLQQEAPTKRKNILKYLENGYSNSSFEKVVSFIQEKGGTVYSHKKASEFGQKALESIQFLPDSIYNKSLKDLVAFALKRDK